MKEKKDNSWLFWLNVKTLRTEIKYAGADGSGPIRKRGTLFFTAALDLALDVTGYKLYWSTDNGKIRCVDIDGSDVETLYSGLDNPSGIVLDVARGKMYWRGHKNGRSQIWRGNLDGSGAPETIYSIQSRIGHIALDISSKLPITVIRAAPSGRAQKLQETALLSNYPNPFNPETWIPYQLATSADVTLTIYDIKGHRVRELKLGHQRAGIYHDRSRAAYWDGRNAQGEPVASGVYFYTLTAGNFTATRKMLIRK